MENVCGEGFWLGLSWELPVVGMHGVLSADRRGVPREEGNL